MDVPSAWRVCLKLFCNALPVPSPALESAVPVASLAPERASPVELPATLMAAVVSAPLVASACSVLLLVAMMHELSLYTASRDRPVKGVTQTRA
jgi:hypothetical protein